VKSGNKRKKSGNEHLHFALPSREACQASFLREICKTYINKRKQDNNKVDSELNYHIDLGEIPNQERGNNFK
jgi:hypothetical protein